MLQGEQQTVFVVIASALSGTGGPNVHYVDDPGGSGKSFLFVKLLHLVRGKGAEVTSSVGGNASGKKKKYNNRREDSWYSGGKKSRVETGEAQSARREVPFRSASAQR